MSWSEVTITQKGEQLLSRMLNGSKLIFSRAAVGSEASSAENLPKQTAVAGLIAAPALLAEMKELDGKNGTQIKIQITNSGVTETTRMKQIGIYAKTDHEEEVLFAILQDEIGEEVPAFAEFSEFMVELWAAFAIARTNNIQIIQSPSVFATVEQLDEAVAAFATKMESFSIEEDAWEELEEARGDYAYSASIEAENITAADSADVRFDIDSLAACAEAQIAPAGETGDGEIIIYAKAAPTAAVSGVYIVQKGV